MNLFETRGKKPGYRMSLRHRGGIAQTAARGRNVAVIEFPGNLCQGIALYWQLKGAVHRAWFSTFRSSPTVVHEGGFTTADENVTTIFRRVSPRL